MIKPWNVSKKQKNKAVLSDALKRAGLEKPGSAFDS